MSSRYDVHRKVGVLPPDSAVDIIRASATIVAIVDPVITAVAPGPVTATVVIVDLLLHVERRRWPPGGGRWMLRGRRTRPCRRRRTRRLRRRTFCGRTRGGNRVGAAIYARAAEHGGRFQKPCKFERTCRSGTRGSVSGVITLFILSGYRHRTC